jgi:hypothetical protein
MKVGDTVIFNLGQSRVTGVIEEFDGPKAKVVIVRSLGKGIWVNTSTLRKVAQK